jgi:hypothetical protein
LAIESFEYHNDDEAPEKLRRYAGKGSRTILHANSKPQPKDG